MEKDKKEINYFEIIKKAFLMTWKNKSMWFFGFLVFIGSFTFIFNNSEISDEQKNQFTNSIQNLFQKYPLLTGAITLAIIIIVAVLYLLKLVATAALIKMANDIAVYKQTKIKSIFSESKEYIWRLLGMEIIIALSLFVISITILMPIAYLFSNNSNLLAAIFLIFGFLIIALIVLLAYYLLIYGQIFLVLGQMNIKMSLESAYELFEKCFKESLFFGIIAVALNISFLIILSFTLIIVSLILALIGFLAYLAFSNTGAISFLIIGGLILLAVTILLFSWFSAFMQSLWVLFFQQLSLKKKKDKASEKENEVVADAIIPDPEAV